MPRVLAPVPTAVGRMMRPSPYNRDWHGVTIGTIVKLGDDTMAAGADRDVRMRGFQTRVEVGQLIHWIDQRVKALGAEPVGLSDASQRVLSHDVTAACAVPGFDRAAMDGYALHGVETFGADGYTPLDFEVIGESLPARPYVGRVEIGQAVRIMTGAPIPNGADAIAQAEIADEFLIDKSPRVRLSEAVPPGRHIGRRGEDIEAGSIVLRAGRLLRPQDLGVLASIGASPVSVVRRPSAAILVTGDELLPCGSKPDGYRIVDSNSVMLAALLRRDGVTDIRIEMLKDRYDIVTEALAGANEDVVLITGGSSVGIEDHAPRVLAELGELVAHGVALRPASPTGLGFMGGRPVFLMPGNPVSCLCAYDLFAGRAARRLGGRSSAMPYPTQTLPLARKIASMVGRVDYVRVQICDGRVEPLAISGASILSSTTRADGFVIVPGDLEGYAECDSVVVHLYDS
jgi:molybdopterin molybdotransferase